MLTALTRFLRPSFLALLMFAPAAAHAGDNPIVIGQTIDLSGPNGSIGRDYVAGIKTCFDMVNSSGGINGRRIQFIARDDRGEPSAAAHAVTELIERDRVEYLFGGVGDTAVDAVLDAPAFRRSSLALFAPLATGDYGERAPILFWRPAYQQEISHTFTHFGKLGINTVGIVLQDAQRHAEAYRSASAEIARRGMKQVVLARIGAGGERAGEEARRVAGARPGFVLVIGDTISTALFLKEYRKHDAQTFVAGTSLTNLSTLRELAGPRAVEWTVFSQVVPNPNAGTSLLQVEHLNMMRRYRDEAVSSLTLEGFAAAKSLVHAIRLGKRGNRSSLQEAFGQSGVDLGGYSALIAPNGNRLSSYLDMALFAKGSGLVF